jgi:hypothetical protein
MLGDVIEELRATRARLEDLERHLESLGKVLAEKECSDAAAAEMRELAAQMNRVVLTLALSKQRAAPSPGADFETDAMAAHQADPEAVSKSRISHNLSA